MKSGMNINVAILFIQNEMTGTPYHLEYFFYLMKAINWKLTLQNQFTSQRYSYY